MTKKTPARALQSPTEPSQKPSFVTYEEFKLVTDNIVNALKESNRNFEEIKKIVELIYQDRELMKDIYEQGGALRSALIAYDKHNEELKVEAIKETVKTQDIVADKVEEVKEHVGIVKDMKVRVVKGRNMIDKLKFWKRR